MSVIVSDSNNASYDGMLATVNGFFRAESWNLGPNGTTTLALTTAQPIPMTFANAGNFQGVVLSILSNAATQDRGIYCALQQNQGTVTFDLGNDLIIQTGHGLTNGTRVSFSSTGVLPTGIGANTPYFVRDATANNFKIEGAVGLGAINIYGTPTGTCTMWPSKTEVYLTTPEIIGYHNDGDPNVNRAYCQVFMPVKMTPFAVDTNANKWRILGFQTGGTTGTYHFITSNGTAAFHVAWCDTPISHTNDDVLIVADKVTINKSFSVKGLLGTGETAYSTAGVVCRAEDYLPDNVALLEWENPPVSSYTMTIDGQIWLGGHSGFRIGTLTSPIPTAQKAVVNTVASTNGTYKNSGFRCPIGSTSSSSSFPMKESFFLYGEIPDFICGTLAQDSNIGVNTITLEETPTGWANGQRVCIGGNDVSGAGDTGVGTYLIDSVVGKTVTLQVNIANYNRLAGGKVINFSGFGIEWSGPDNTNYAYNYLYNPSNLKIQGCSFTDVYMNVGDGSYYYCEDDDEYKTKHEVFDNVARMNGSTATMFFGTLHIPTKGADFKRNYAHRCIFLAAFNGFINSYMKAGVGTCSDNVTVSSYTGVAINPSSGTLGDLVIENNIIDGSARYGMNIGYAQNLVLKNNTFWGVVATYASNYYTLQLGQIINPQEISGNHLDKCGVAVRIGPSVTKAFIDTGMTFGEKVANTYDLVVDSGGMIDMEYRDSVGITTVDFAGMADCIDGSRLRFTNYNSLTLDDRVYSPFGNWQRCGTGLVDTTSRTGGAGNYSLRFEPTSSTSKLIWTQKVPTGDISGKTMQITAWIKINNATYYAGTHTNPTLRVKYDDATEVTDVATNSTDWQQLQVRITPSTTFGQIDISIEGATDVSTTNAYFYLDDIAVNYPDGVAVDLGNLNLWANALPITPTIATVPSLGSYSLDDIYTKLETLLTEDTFVALSD